MKRSNGPGSEPHRPSGPGGAGREHTPDELKRELLALRSLIESTAVRHRARFSQSTLVEELRPTEVHPTIQALIGEATTTLEVALSGDADFAESAYDALRKTLGARGHSVHTRLLCGAASLDEAFVRDSLAAGHGLEVRTTEMPPLSTVVLDSSVALVSVGTAGASRASLIRAETPLRAVHTLYDNVWGSATLLTRRIHFGDVARRDTVGQVLRRLRDGVTDEVAARELGMSVRTYRRYVAEIMALLGAESRFQAGVYAAELGLLPTQDR
ncbi:helix-turn-helix transcriptional regulator [Streptomyces profundus]|uniref:helix-turn-helix transcriptional regulator n=1 Tax=Streptomyces profundus TaxID=2867410 RepID=UPI001D16A3F3|nr:LuxR family transcriptional regulator [Streptomyces sp. MA3_2.13]UED87033.1 LuxR family transcriptional regulator [Streptomyces sp. MA3_2.13]